MRRFYATTTCLGVDVPHGTGMKQLRLERGCQRLRQHHHPVLAAFGIAHHDHPAIKIHILDAQAKTFHHPATPMPADKKAHPIKAGFLRLEAIVQVTNTLSKLVKEPGRGKRGSAGFHGCFIAV